MPLNSSPPVLDAKAFDAKRQAAEEKSVTDFGIWGGLTPDNLDHMEELAERGVVGFKAFMCDSGIDEFKRADDLTLYEGMQKAARLRLPVAVHAESEEITRGLTNRARAAGNTSVSDYLATRPVIAEFEAVSRAIAIASRTGCKLHLVHLSSVEAVFEVMRASRLIDVTCETCPHYFLLNEQDAKALGAIAKCAPPLRQERTCRFLWSILFQDGIDFVASDHSPASPNLKTSSDCFANWGGISGCQSLLASVVSIAMRFGAPPGKPPVEKPLPNVARVTAANVAKRYKIPHKGRIETGFDADLALLDLSTPYTLRAEDLMYRHKQSPFVGKEFRGRIIRTIRRGETIFCNGKVTATAGGKLVRPTRR
jgi:allantoinase